MSLKDTYARMMNAFLVESLSDTIRVETMEDDRTLIQKDGTMVSFLSMGGALRTPGEAEIGEMVERMRIAMSPYLSDPGHAIDFCFLRDSSAARRELEVQVGKTGRNARSLGLDIEDVLEERRRVLSERMVSETCIIVVYTRPSVLGTEEAKEEGGHLKEKMSKNPALFNGPSPVKGMDGVFTRHEAITDALNRSLPLPFQGSLTCP